MNKKKFLVRGTHVKIKGCSCFKFHYIKVSTIVGFMLETTIKWPPDNKCRTPDNIFFLPGTIRLPYNPNVHEEYWIVMPCAFRIFKCLGEFILCTGWPIVLNFDTVFMFRSISFTECFCLCSFLTSSALILDNGKHNVIILLGFFSH